jgi:hypothetical protein
MKLINEIPDEKIIRIVDKLGNANLIIGAQLYDKYKDDKDVKSIRDAANKQIKDYNTLALEKPGLALLTVVLSANRNYAKHVEPRVNKLKSDNKILSIKDLEKQLDNRKSFFNYINYHDDKKYNTLQNLISAINLKLYPKYGSSIKEYDLLNKWAQDVDLINLDEDPLRIRNFGLASIQHLRMIFGVNTCKPDQRVLEVFKNEFGVKLTQIEAVIWIENIARICNCEPLLIDQIFVNYGSGYYQKANRKGINL